MGAADGNSFVQLSNGQYVFIRKAVQGSGGRLLVAFALIPVLWQYYISTTNLTPEFTDIASAEERVRITAAATEIPVKSSSGNTLFYLEYKPRYHAPPHDPGTPPA